MRKLLLSSLDSLIFVAGYFLLLDFVRPALEERHLLALWWGFLGLYLIVGFAVGQWSTIRARPKFIATGFLLLAAAVYSFDPTIISHLDSVGLGGLWIVFLAAFFFWLVMFVRTSRGENKEKLRDRGQ